MIRRRTHRDGWPRRWRLLWGWWRPATRTKRDGFTASETLRFVLTDAQGRQETDITDEVRSGRITLDFTEDYP